MNNFKGALDLSTLEVINSYIIKYLLEKLFIAHNQFSLQLLVLVVWNGTDVKGLLTFQRTYKLRGNVYIMGTY